MSKRLYLLLFIFSFCTIIRAQFVDIDWSGTDTIVPYYTETYELESDWRKYNYDFSIEYAETEEATQEDIERFRITKENLENDFIINSHIGTSRKKGVMIVSVFPFAFNDGKIIKLISFKPVLNKKIQSADSIRRTEADGKRFISERYKENSLLSSSRWIKIRTKDAGVYELTKAKLLSLGFKNPAKVRLYGYNLPVLPEGGIENLPDDLTEIPLWRKSDGSALFYSCGTTRWTRSSQKIYEHFNNPYSTHIYYFLTENDSIEPAVFTVESSIENATNTSTSFYDYALIESDDFSFINVGRMFFENYDFANGNKKSYKLDLPGIESNNATLRVQFAAGGSTSSRLQVSDTDGDLYSLTFSKLEDYVYARISSRNFTWNNAKESNNITLTHTRNTGTTGHLDYIRASYSRKLEMTGNTLLFRPSSQKATEYKIGNASANTKVWRVTSPETTCEISGTLSDNTYTFSTISNSWLNEEYLAVNTESNYPVPEIVGQIENQNLHSLSNIDFVIIVPSNGVLKAQAQRLADAHTEKEGMKCVVVTAEKIYNEFSSGTPDATAYRRFVKMLYDKAETEDEMPKNLLLFGDGLWDNRMITASMRRKNQDDYLLCYESDESVSTTESFVLEEYFAILDDGEGYDVLKDKPDIGYGRIPVTNTEEAKFVVDKLIRYINNEEAGAWKNTICILADDGNGNLHMSDADGVRENTINQYPDYNYRRIYWDSFKRESSATGYSYPDAYAQINKQMQDGALIMNYTGHGAAYCLSHEQVLKRNDFARWSSPRLPLWITAGCDISPFDMNEENIGKTALLNKKGAAMGVMTTTRTTYSSANKSMNINIMKYLLAKKESGIRYTIGEALQMAKCKSADYRKTKYHWILLGDPAITLHTPEYKIEIEKFNKNTDTDEINSSVHAGSVVTIEGKITDEHGNIAESFNGIVSPTIYDNIEKVLCKYNSRNDQAEQKYEVEPYEYYERLRTLYIGTDSVRNGRFTFTFPVPLDINYSNETGQIKLYAVNENRDVEAHGTYEKFTVGGTNPEISTDTIGPEITAYLNSESFSNGDRTNTTPLLIAHLADKDGINTTGSGIGHDITAIIDNDESMTYNLNGYFMPHVGDYTQGTIAFSLPQIEPGRHTLTIRAFDILNNQSSKEIEFEVSKNANPTIYNFTCNIFDKEKAIFTINNDRPQTPLNVRITIYDTTGRKVAEATENESSNSSIYTFAWYFTATGIRPGIYIAQAEISTADGAKTSKAIKVAVTSGNQ